MGESRFTGMVGYILQQRLIACFSAKSYKEAHSSGIVAGSVCGQLSLCQASVAIADSAEMLSSRTVVAVVVSTASCLLKL